MPSTGRPSPQRHWRWPARLFPSFEPRRYVAVDISVQFLRRALQQLQREHPAMDLVGVGLDFSARLSLPVEACSGPALVFHPGSSIGNFAPYAALRLLRQAREVAAGGALLIGADLVKSAGLLQKAFDDDLGVTAAFNLNLLKHLNRLLGADFDVCEWRHVALSDAAQSRIEMHLEASLALTVRWPGGERSFAAAGQAAGRVRDERGAEEGRTGEAGHAPMIASTARLNTAGPELAELPGVHTLADFTGFGLAGHALEVARGARCEVQLDWAAVPLLPQAFAPEDRALLTDPQTSGGLLVACEPAALDAVRVVFLRHGFAQAAVVGRIADAGGTARLRVS